MNKRYWGERRKGVCRVLVSIDGRVATPFIGKFDWGEFDPLGKLAHGRHLAYIVHTRNLATALLTDAVDKVAARRLGSSFESKVLVRLDLDNWNLDADWIRNWTYRTAILTANEKKEVSK